MGDELHAIAEAHGHGADELCEAGTELYARALEEGAVPGEDAAAAPCLIAAGLLHPVIGDPLRLEPAAPATALHRLLRGIADRVAEERRREERLAAAFEPLLRIAERRTAPGDTGTPAITLLSGVERINAAITEAMAEATREMLCIQPHTHQHGPRGQEGQAGALGRDQALLARGARICTLYPHTLRHSPSSWPATNNCGATPRRAPWTRSPTASSSSTARWPSFPPTPNGPWPWRSAIPR